MEPWVASAVATVVASCVLGVGGYLMGHARRITDDARRKSRQADVTTLMVCRLCIYNEHFSTDEKVDAYRIYRDLGGNSHAKHAMDELLGGDADTYLANHPE